VVSLFSFSFKSLQEIPLVRVKTGRLNLVLIRYQVKFNDCDGKA
jgi:hypothetical protein